MGEAERSHHLDREPEITVSFRTFDRTVAAVELATRLSGARDDEETVTGDKSEYSVASYGGGEAPTTMIIVWKEGKRIRSIVARDDYGPMRNICAGESLTFSRNKNMHQEQLTDPELEEHAHRIEQLIVEGAFRARRRRQRP